MKPFNDKRNSTPGKSFDKNYDTEKENNTYRSNIDKTIVNFTNDQSIRVNDQTQFLISSVEYDANTRDTQKKTPADTNSQPKNSISKKKNIDSAKNFEQCKEIDLINSNTKIENFSLKRFNKVKKIKKVSNIGEQSQNVRSIVQKSVSQNVTTSNERTKVITTQKNYNDQMESSVNNKKSCDNITEINNNITNNTNFSSESNFLFKSTHCYLDHSHKDYGRVDLLENKVINWRSNCVKKYFVAKRDGSEPRNSMLIKCNSIQKENEGEEELPINCSKSCGKFVISTENNDVYIRNRNISAKKSEFDIEAYSINISPASQESLDEKKIENVIKEIGIEDKPSIDIVNYSIELNFDNKTSHVDIDQKNKKSGDKFDEKEYQNNPSNEIKYKILSLSIPYNNDPLKIVNEENPDSEGDNKDRIHMYTDSNKDKSRDILISDNLLNFKDSLELNTEHIREPIKIEKLENKYDVQTIKHIRDNVQDIDHEDIIIRYNSDTPANNLYENIEKEEIIYTKTESHQHLKQPKVIKIKTSEPAEKRLLKEVFLNQPKNIESKNNESIIIMESMEIKDNFENLENNQEPKEISKNFDEDQKCQKNTEKKGSDSKYQELKEITEKEEKMNDEIQINIKKEDNGPEGKNKILNTNLKNSPEEENIDCLKKKNLNRSTEFFEENTDSLSNNIPYSREKDKIVTNSMLRKQKNKLTPPNLNFNYYDVSIKSNQKLNEDILIENINNKDKSSLLEIEKMNDKKCSLEKDEKRLDNLEERNKINDLDDKCENNNYDFVKINTFNPNALDTNNSYQNLFDIHQIGENEDDDKQQEASPSNLDEFNNNEKHQYSQGLLFSKINNDRYNFLEENINIQIDANSKINDNYTKIKSRNDQKNSFEIEINFNRNINEQLLENKSIPFFKTEKRIENKQFRENRELTEKSTNSEEINQLISHLDNTPYIPKKKSFYSFSNCNPLEKNKKIQAGLIESNFNNNDQSEADSFDAKQVSIIPITDISNLKQTHEQVYPPNDKKKEEHDEIIEKEETKDNNEKDDIKNENHDDSSFTEKLKLENLKNLKISKLNKFLTNLYPDDLAFSQENMKKDKNDLLQNQVHDKIYESNSIPTYSMTKLQEVKHEINRKIEPTVDSKNNQSQFKNNLNQSYIFNNSYKLNESNKESDKKGSFIKIYQNTKNIYNLNQSNLSYSNRSNISGDHNNSRILRENNSNILSKSFKKNTDNSAIMKDSSLVFKNDDIIKADNSKILEEKKNRQIVSSLKDQVPPKKFYEDNNFNKFQNLTDNMLNYFNRNNLPSYLYDLEKSLSNKIKISSVPKLDFNDNLSINRIMEKHGLLNDEENSGFGNNNNSNKNSTDTKIKNDINNHNDGLNLKSTSEKENYNLPCKSEYDLGKPNVFRETYEIDKKEFVFTKDQNSLNPTQNMNKSFIKKYHKRKSSYDFHTSDSYNDNLFKKSFKKENKSALKPQFEKELNIKSNKIFNNVNNSYSHIYNSNISQFKYSPLNPLSHLDKLSNIINTPVEYSYSNLENTQKDHTQTIKQTYENYINHLNQIAKRNNINSLSIDLDNYRLEHDHNLKKINNLINSYKTSLNDCECDINCKICFDFYLKHNHFLHENEKRAKLFYNLQENKELIHTPINSFCSEPNNKGSSLFYNLKQSRRNSPCDNSQSNSNFKKRINYPVIYPTNKLF